MPDHFGGWCNTALGNPLALSLTGGQVHDIKEAGALAVQVEPGALLADKGYDADSLINSLTARRIEVVIPPKSNRTVLREWKLYFIVNAISSNGSST